MKTKQILSFVWLGKEYKVIKHYGVNNPYYIYHIYNDFNKAGIITEHKKLMIKYANLASCFYWFIDNNIGF